MALACGGSDHLPCLLNSDWVTTGKSVSLQVEVHEIKREDGGNDDTEEEQAKRIAQWVQNQLQVQKGVEELVGEGRDPQAVNQPVYARHFRTKPGLPDHFEWKDVLFRHTACAIVLVRIAYHRTKDREAMFAYLRRVLR